MPRYASKQLLGHGKFILTKRCTVARFEMHAAAAGCERCAKECIFLCVPTRLEACLSTNREGSHRGGGGTLDLLHELMITTSHCSSSSIINTDIQGSSARLKVCTIF
jgi:hypothetical protein